MDIDPLGITIASALVALHKKDVDVSELYQICHQQIIKLNPIVNAFITVLDNEKINQSKQTKFPFPIAVKDLIDVAGISTTAGSPKFFGENVAGVDATVVKIVRSLGASIIGKTNTHEIALGVTGINPHCGPVYNPHKLDRIAGGSSSGSAAAVSAGMAFVGLGTDTGGSIRIPSSFCGVVGMKPTRGRVSVRGIFPLSWNLDHAGFITRSVEDCAILLQILAGYDPDDPASVNKKRENYITPLKTGIKKWRVAFADGNLFDNVDEDILSTLNVARKVIIECGAVVHEYKLPWLKDLMLANTLMIQADAAAFHNHRLLAHPEWFGADVRHRLEKGAATKIKEYVDARRTQAEGTRRMEEFFIENDILILPTTPISAPLVDGADALQAARELTRFTSPFNLTGLPALSIPSGCSKDGLPIGIQIISNPWGDLKIMQAGYSIEKAINLNIRPKFLCH